jgi:hypothetical protein
MNLEQGPVHSAPPLVAAGRGDSEQPLRIIRATTWPGPGLSASLSRRPETMTAAAIFRNRSWAGAGQGTGGRGRPILVL